MKAKTFWSLMMILALTVSASYAQEITVTTTKANTVSSKVFIELPGLANNPEAIIVATPVGDTQILNPHAIGAWYNNNTWSIFNCDHAMMPLGLTFKVQVFLKPGANQFLHLTTKENLDNEGSFIDNPALAY